MGPALPVRGAADSLTWAQCCSSVTANDLRWAQRVSSNMLPMVPNRPSVSPRLNYRWSQMGPTLPLRSAADGLEGAQCLSSVKVPMVSDGPSIACEVLPIASHGPSVASQRHCRWSHMGPAGLLQFTADDLKWAQCLSSVKLPTASDGPSTARERCCR
jgi:hypothetical protein